MRKHRALGLIVLCGAIACSGGSPAPSTGAGAGAGAGTGTGAGTGAGAGGGAGAGAGADAGGSGGGGGAPGGSGSPGPHVANPYAGAVFYVNPAWAANVRATAAQTTDPALAAKLTTVAGYSTAVWLDAIARIAPTDGTMGLAQHLDAALAQQKGSTPVVVTLVVYDLPGRDCAALASNGELPATAAGLDTYEHAYVDAIASVLAQPKYAPCASRRSSSRTRSPTS